MDRERLRSRRLRFPLGVLSTLLVTSTSDSDEETVCESRSLRFCHSGTLAFFSRFVRLFLRLRGDELLSLSLESSHFTAGLGLVASEHTIFNNMRIHLLTDHERKENTDLYLSAQVSATSWTSGSGSS
jgi:hypothetical protein